MRAALIICVFALTWPVAARGNPGNEPSPRVGTPGGDVNPKAASSKPQRTPGAQLADARTEFLNKDFAEAAKDLKDLLFPPPGRLALKDDIAEAHLLLGVCLVETGFPGEAKDEFRELLHLVPNKILDPLAFSTKAISIFNETRADVAEELRMQQADDAQLKVQQYLSSLRPIEVHPFWENFVPFGGAQYLEHRTGYGVLFTSTQSVTLFTSAGIWLYLAGKYGIVSNAVPPQDVSTVRALQGLEIVSGGAFIFFYGWGLFDSFRNYRPEVILKADESLLPPELRPPPKPKKTSLRDRIHVFPMPTAHGGGIGIGWEN